jgi:hypothetical protein
MRPQVFIAATLNSLGLTGRGMTHLAYSELVANTFKDTLESGLRVDLELHPHDLRAEADPATATLSDVRKSMLPCQYADRVHLIYFDENDKRQVRVMKWRS